LSTSTPAALLDDDEDISFDDRADVGQMPVGMLVPTLALIAVGVALTVAAGPIFAYSERAADEVINRTQYITAVVGGERP
jgi:multicomponent Na+:H+ antiporter subunit D